MRISELATSLNGDFVAAASFDKVVEVWDLQTQTTVCNMETLYSFGGRRLAIDSAGRRLVAGGYGRGVRCHDVPSGSVVWHAKGFIGVQGCSLPEGGETVIVDCAKGGSQVLNRETGARIETIPGARHVYSFPTGGQLIERRRGLTHFRGDDVRKIKMETFALLDAVSVEDSLILSFASGPLQRVRLTDGAVLWESHKAGYHYLRLSPALVDGFLYAVRYGYHVSRSTLRRIDWATGRHKSVLSSKCVDSKFAKAGTLLVTTDRSIYRCADGAQIGEIAPLEQP